MQFCATNPEFCATLSLLEVFQDGRWRSWKPVASLQFDFKVKIWVFFFVDIFRSFVPLTFNLVPPFSQNISRCSQRRIYLAKTPLSIIMRGPLSRALKAEERVNISTTKNVSKFKIEILTSFWSNFSLRKNVNFENQTRFRRPIFNTDCEFDLRFYL